MKKYLFILLTIVMTVLFTACQKQILNGEYKLIEMTIHYEATDDYEEYEDFFDEEKLNETGIEAILSVNEEDSTFTFLNEELPIEYSKMSSTLLIDNVEYEYYFNGNDLVLKEGNNILKFIKL